MTDSKALVHQAIDLSDDEKYQDAVELLTKAIAIDSSNAQAYFERGMALLNLERDADAVPDFDHALSIDSDFPGARDWRARAFESLGGHRQAAADRLEDLRRNPDGRHPGMGVSPQDWADCAEAFISAGDPETARRLLQEYFEGPVRKVTKYQSYATAPMRVMARLLMKAEESDLAFKFAADAFKDEHCCPVDEELYGIMLASRGSIDEAKSIYEKLTKGLPPGMEYAEDLKEAIENAQNKTN
jgi:tetratricopeptide (TPR) repeat protein